MPSDGSAGYPGAAADSPAPPPEPGNTQARHAAAQDNRARTIIAHGLFLTVMATPTSVTSATPRAQPNAAYDHEKPTALPTFQRCYSWHGAAVNPMKPDGNSFTMLDRRSSDSAEYRQMTRAMHFEHDSCFSYCAARNTGRPSNKTRLPATEIAEFVSAAKHTRESTELRHASSSFAT